MRKNDTLNLDLEPIVNDSAHTRRVENNPQLDFDSEPEQSDKIEESQLFRPRLRLVSLE